MGPSTSNNLVKKMPPWSTQKFISPRSYQIKPSLCIAVLMGGKSECRDGAAQGDAGGWGRKPSWRWRHRRRWCLQSTTTRDSQDATRSQDEASHQSFTSDFQTPFCPIGDPICGPCGDSTSQLTQEVCILEIHPPKSKALISVLWNHVRGSI